MAMELHAEALNLDADVPDWSRGRTNISWDRRLSLDRRRMERVFTASAFFWAEIENFPCIQYFLGDLSKNKLIHLDCMEWVLTDETWDKAAREARVLAVQDARAKAQDYGRVQQSNHHLPCTWRRQFICG
ncbi:hypothetical protein BDV12DRAFT_46337 [Aspergillus spectabilis]